MVARELGISMELIKIIFNFVKFIATKKVGQQILFPSSFLLLLHPGSGMEEKMRIRDEHPGTGMSFQFSLASTELVVTGGPGGGP